MPIRPLRGGSILRQMAKHLSIGGLICVRSSLCRRSRSRSRAADAYPLHARLEAPKRAQLVFPRQEQGLFRGGEPRRPRSTKAKARPRRSSVSCRGPMTRAFGDINAIIQNAGVRPELTPIMVYMIYNSSPFVLASMKNGPIQSIKDLANHKRAHPPAARRSPCSPPWPPERHSAEQHFDDQHVAQPARTTHRQSAGGCRCDLQHHLVHELHGHQDRSGERGQLVLLQGLRDRPVLERRDGLAASASRKAGGGARSRPGDKPRAAGCPRPSGRRDGTP